MGPVRPLIALAARVLSPPHSTRRRPVRRQAIRLGIEPLEDRLVLSTITVTDPGDNGLGTLRWAVDQANQGFGEDVINFDTDLVLSGIPIWLTTGQLSLTDTTGTTTIDGGSTGVTITGNDLSRVFWIGTGASAELHGLTITQGHANVVNSSYTSGNGGGIYNLGELTLNRCVLYDNFATHEGGGIFNDVSGHLTISDSSLSHNVADFGGGIASRGDLTVANSHVSYNSAGDGGGIGNAAGVLTISGSTVSYNNAGGNGGGIYSSWNQSVSASAIIHNSAENGGAIFSIGGTLTVSESTLSSNSASICGGGIYSAGGNLTLTESTVVYNSASTAGGIASYPPAIPNPPTSILHNALVAGNVLRNSNPPIPSDLVGTYDASSSYSLIGDGSGALDGARGNLLGTPSNPLDPMLGPLQNNGGPTWTHALSAGSPAINTGDPAILPAQDLYDQRGPGFARVVGGPIDIGAYEVQVLTSQEHLADVTNAVRALVIRDVLPLGVGESTAAKMDVARALLDHGNKTPVVKMLDAFIKQVVGLRKAGKLTDADAQYLIDSVQRVIDLLGED